MKIEFVTPETIISIAQVIGACDFRTYVSLYTTSRFQPWIITVGESDWKRHLIVEKLADGNLMDTILAVLTTSESEKNGYDIRADSIQCTITLRELVSQKYIGVKKVLYPSNRSVR